MSEAFVPRLAIALVHFPIVDREKKVIATNITNFDIHDISRAARVYGVEKYFLVHPIQEQLMFVERVLDHWRVGKGAKFNPSRRISLERTCTARNLDQVLLQWPGNGEKPYVVTTHARPVPGTQNLSITELREVLWGQKKPVLLIFGTGNGLTDEFMVNCDALLESLRGAPPEDFRHFSVRSAVSIYLDRLMGPW